MMLQQFEDLKNTTFYYRDDGKGDLKTCRAKASELSLQLAVLEHIEPVARSIRQSEKDLPINKLTFNIKTLSKAQHDARWAKLQTLGCGPAIFCMLAFGGLASASNKEYDWLLVNVKHYMKAQELPQDWITSLKIRQAMSRAPRQNNTRDFIECYNRLEVQFCDLRKCDTRRHDLPDQNPPAKRICTENDRQKHFSPLNGKREMKYMFSNATPDTISILPEPFKAAVENSRLWKWERSQNLDTTSCLASLFPKDGTQDVSFTIWCGCNDGYHLNTVFGMKREVGS